MSKQIQTLNNIPEAGRRRMANFMAVLLAKPESYWKTPHGQRRLARLFLAHGDRSLYDAQLARFLSVPEPVVTHSDLTVKIAKALADVLRTTSESVVTAWKEAAARLEHIFSDEIDGLLAGSGVRELRSSLKAQPASLAKSDQEAVADRKIWEWPEKGAAGECGLRVVAFAYPETRELVFEATLSPGSNLGLEFCVRNDQKRMSARFDPVTGIARIRIPRQGWRGWSKFQPSVEPASSESKE